MGVLKQAALDAYDQPVQVPVAWLRKRDNTLALNDGGLFGSDWTPLYAASPQPDESFCDTHCTWLNHHPYCEFRRIINER